MDDFAELLDTAERGGGHRPFLTWVDLEAGERVELSFVVAANWARKTANYAIDACDAGPGAVLAWPPLEHWTTPLVALGLWAAGAGVRAGERDSRLPDPLTPDFNQVLAEPDQLDADRPQPSDPALDHGGQIFDHAWLLEEAQRAELPGRRFRLDGPPLTRGWCAHLARTLAVVPRDVV